MTFCSGPHGGQSKSTPTQQPSKVMTEIESAKNTGHYRSHRSGTVSLWHLLTEGILSFSIYTCNRTKGLTRGR